MRTAADLEAAAAAAGLTVASSELVPVSGGGTAVATRMQFPDDDPWAAARLLFALADEDASDPVVRAWALDMLRATADELGESDGPTVSPALRDAQARTIHANVKDAIQFVHEPEETFQSARVTMQTAAGDCDDHARLVYALALASDIPARIVFFEKNGQPIHVVTQLEDADGSWHWAETTIDAAYGEEPHDALARLDGSIAAHQNPFSHAGMGAISGPWGFVTPADVQQRKDELNAVATSIDADVQKCTALDTATISAWNEFLSAWRTFYADEPSIWNAGGQGRQTSDYADQIINWQEKLAPVCKLSSPMLPAQEDTASVVKWGAVAVTAVAAAWGVKELVTAYRVSRGRP
jgi:hypothetical protein